MAREYTLHRVPVASPPPRVPACPPGGSGGRPGAGAAGGAGGAERASPRLVICGISERSERSAARNAQSKTDFLRHVYDEAPITGFRVMRRDVLTVRSARDPDKLAARLEDTKRGEIESLSYASRKRLAIIAANTDVVFRSFVTVTYPKAFPCDGLLVKEHLHALLAALRRKCGGQLSYLWFLEFQKRGAPHFHAFLDQELPEPLSTLARRGGRVRKSVRVHLPWQDWLCRRWFEIVGSGDDKHLRAGAAWEVVEKPDGAARYVAKECYKTFQKVVPPDFQNVGRFWGCSRDVPPPEGRLIPCTDAEMKRIFPAQFLDKEGRPYPVMFGAAPHYDSICNTSLDPVKRKQWKRTKRNETAELLIVEKISKPVGIESSY